MAPPSGPVVPFVLVSVIDWLWHWGSVSLTYLMNVCASHQWRLEAPELAKDRRFWRIIATAEGYDDELTDDEIDDIDNVFNCFVILCKCVQCVLSLKLLTVLYCCRLSYEIHFVILSVSHFNHVCIENVKFNFQPFKFQKFDFEVSTNFQVSTFNCQLVKNSTVQLN